MGVLFSPARSLVEMGSQHPQNVSTELADLTRKVNAKATHHIEYKPRDGGCLVVQIQSTECLGVS